MATINNGESGSSVRTKLNDIINKVEGVTSINNDIKLGDNDKAIFGAGSDLQIYHDGNHSRIVETGGGDLIIQGDEFSLMNVAGTEYMIFADNDSFVKLYYDGSAKLATTSTGIDVTGTVTADGLTVGVTNKIDFGGGIGEYASSPSSGIVGFTSRGSVSLFTDSNNNGSLTGDAFVVYDGAEYGGTTKTLLKVTKGNDISFYEDTGTTPKMVWSASAEALGIGTDSPTSILELSDTTAPIITLDSTDSSGQRGLNFQYTGITYGQIGQDPQTGELRIRSGETGQTGYYIKFDTDGTEAMRIDSSGNVGIGTSSPSASLTVTDGSSAGTLSIGDNAAGSTSVRYLQFGESNDYSIQSNANSYLRFYAGGAEAARFDASGNLGIGDTTPDAKLHVAVTGASTGLSEVSRFERFTSGDNAYLRILVDNANNLVQYDSSGSQSGSHVFLTGNTERMRLDGSGSLLVGKTSPSINSLGVEARGIGLFSATRESNPAGYFTRNTDDGDIVLFRKDTATVGSIGTNSGVPYFYGSSGFRLGGAIQPVTSAGALSDNTTDIGQSNARFKNLYLSGGVYLGGTGAANKLDDYEEGTFTATLKGSTGEPATLITATDAKYTKVGDTVFIEISYENVDTTGYSGDISIDTLPFTSGTGRSVLNVAHYQTSSWGTTDIPIALIGGSTTTVSFLNYSSGTTWQTTTHSAGSGRYLWITGTYKV